MLSVALGVLGAFLPLLPTTVFFLIAAFCFARSSDRFYGMLLTNRLSGPYIRNYHEGRPMTPRQMTTTLATLWISILLSALLVRSSWVSAILLAVAVGVTTYLVTRNRRLRLQ